VLSRPATTSLLVALAPVLFLALHLDLPLYEDGLFWWVPQALWIVERGPAWIPAGDLPRACLEGGAVPPQWAGGLPDYAHPPLWFHYLAAWIAALGASARTVHLACLPVVAALGAGAVALARRLGGPAAAPLALVPLLSPTLLGQTLRPPTDLPLLAASLWALAALCDGRPWRFAALGVLATWSKEPGVLLAAPALLLGLRDRRFLVAALAGPAALAAWALVHRAQVGWGLAGAERIPESLDGWLRDLGTVARLVLLASGRWAGWVALLLAAGVWALRRARLAPQAEASRAAWLCGTYMGVQILAFSFLNFLGGRGLEQAYTHVRYLLPAAAVGSLLAAALALRLAVTAAGSRLPTERAATVLALLLVAAAVPGARRLHPGGPEANLFGADQARAWTAAAAALQVPAGPGCARVDSHLYTALTRPWVGLVARPVAGLCPLGPSLRPEDLAPGDLLVLCRYGEPLGRLGELVRERVEGFAAGDAWVRVERVLPGRAAPPPTP